MPDYDVIIVGARAAGAALATFLARDGARVLSLEADAHGSDQVLSTHTIHALGSDVLDELGVGEAIRSGLTPSGVRLDQDGIAVDLDAPGRGEICPRRFRLDGILQDAAIAAGATLEFQSRVTELQREGDRVTGVVASRDGSEVRQTAGVVVGADGRHSTVASLVGANEYFGYANPRFVY